MSKASILIVEDESIIARDIQDSLERNGYQVVGRAAEGEVAIKKTEELNPNLILMDINLKGDMDGIEAATQIRARLDIPVIFLTAFSNQSVVERALKVEAFGYILKPFEERELIITIEMALYKHSAERKIRESENKFRAVIEQASDGIALIDRDGIILNWNPAMEQITGLKISEAIGHPVWEITYQLLPKEQKAGQEKETMALAWKAAAQSGYAVPEKMVEKEIETPQGIRRIVQSNGFRLETSQGWLGGVIMRDITDIKALQEAEHEQRQLAEALYDTAMALNSSLRLDDILSRILDNIGKLVPYDVAMVSQVEGNNIRKIRYHGNPETDSRLPLRDIYANLINIPVLKEIVQGKQPILVPDIQKDIRWQAISVPGMQRIRSLLCAPIEYHSNVVGLITIISAIPDFFTSIHIERITAFASQAAVAFEHASLFAQAEHLSMTDPLTELHNMRFFNDFASLEFDRTNRYKRALSIAMIDLDHFKNINDTYGHSIGDLVLHETAARIKSAARSMDVVARYGGEEFVILMPEAGLDEAYLVAERVRRAVGDSPIENKGMAISVTLSAGVAEVDQDVKYLDELIKRADAAMYAAKAAGRNRVERASGPQAGNLPLS